MTDHYKFVTEWSPTGLSRLGIGAQPSPGHDGRAMLRMTPHGDVSSQSGGAAKGLPFADWRGEGSPRERHGKSARGCASRPDGGQLGSGGQSCEPGWVLVGEDEHATAAAAAAPSVGAGRQQIAGRRLATGSALDRSCVTEVSRAPSQADARIRPARAG